MATVRLWCSTFASAMLLWTSKSSCCLSAVRSLFFPRHSLHCCRFHLEQAWWRHVIWTVWVLVVCTRTNLQIQLVGWSCFLDFYFCLRTKFTTLLLSTSCQTHPRLTLLWSLQTTFLKTRLMLILNSHPRCGLKRRMCLEQYLIPAMAQRLIIVVWTLNSMWNILTTLLRLFF